ncbi:MAG TPA: dTDP-glucose 4,6-dehydratase [Gammaproteobacteria bacterium]|nr:dTDP-glucose 4,6-dehydratase [Gammaproteobacteria bacterium]
MRRLLVTGGAGFIGANFVHYWIAQHPQDRIVVLDALTYAGNPASLDAVRDHPQFHFVHGNICDEALVNALMGEERIDTVVHFAAESHVDRSITGPDAFVETNVVGTHVLLKAARRAWLDTKSAARAHRFHHVSTDEVYGSLGSGDPPFTESTPYAPNSPYSASKAASDHLVRAYHHTYGLPVTISNCSNNFGPYQFPEKLIPLMIVNALHAKPLPVYGDGGNVRDWLYVTDHVRGIERVLERGRVGETYNIGGNNERRNIELVEEICGLLDRAFQSSPKLAGTFPDCPAAHEASTCELITYVTDRPGHDRRYAIDAGKISRECGFQPAGRPAAALEATVHWYLANRQWWQPLLQRA